MNKTSGEALRIPYNLRHEVLVGNRPKEIRDIAEFAVGDDLFEGGLCQPDFVFAIRRIRTVQNDTLLQQILDSLIPNDGIPSGILVELDAIPPARSDVIVRQNYLYRYTRTLTCCQTSNRPHSSTLVDGLVETLPSYVSQEAERI